MLYLSTQAEIKANLECLIAVVDSLPEQTMDLDQYRKHDDACGTLYCIGGLTPQIPHFQKLGMSWNYAGASLKAHVYPIRLMPDGYTEMDWETSLFGANAYARLFQRYGEGYNDDLLQARHGSELLTHKELALARLRLALEEHHPEGYTV